MIHFSLNPSRTMTKKSHYLHETRLHPAFFLMTLHNRPLENVVGVRIKYFFLVFCVKKVWKRSNKYIKKTCQHS